MHCVWRICFLSTHQMHNKALWTSFLFKHGSWCVSFTCLSFCSCKMTSQTVEEKTLTNKLSLVPFLFLYFPFLLQFILLLVLFFLFLFLLQPTLILTDLSWCHKFLLLLMSLMPQKRERWSRWSVLKRSYAHPKRRWQESIGAISHNTSFTHCHVLNLMHAWSRWKVAGNWSFSPYLWLTTLFSLP